MGELQHYYCVQRVINTWNKLLERAHEEKKTNDRESHLAFIEGKGCVE